MAGEKPINLIEAIAELKHREPFAPFRIVLTSGHRHLIEVAENLVEMKTEYFYAYPGGEGFVFLRKNQIAAVEQGVKRSVERLLSFLDRTIKEV